MKKEIVNGINLNKLPIVDKMKIIRYKPALSMKKLYMLASDFLLERYDSMGKTAKIIKKKELPYLKEFLDYIWKHKSN